MQRKKHSAEFKAKIALETVKGLKTINEIASEAEVHPISNDSDNDSDIGEMGLVVYIADKECFRSVASSCYAVTIIAKSPWSIKTQV
jgi:hypothetical protein